MPTSFQVAGSLDDAIEIKQRVRGRASEIDRALCVEGERVCGRERVLEMHVCTEMITGVGIRNRIPSCEWHNTIKNHKCAYKSACGRERSKEWERTCVYARVCMRDVLVFGFTSSRLSSVHMRV